MSKIEVLRVPDARLNLEQVPEMRDPQGYLFHDQTTNRSIPVVWDGDLLLVCDEDIEMAVHVSSLFKPALLAALLDDAGAVKYLVGHDYYDEYEHAEANNQCGREIVRVVVLPVQEGEPLGCDCGGEYPCDHCRQPLKLGGVSEGE